VGDDPGVSRGRVDARRLAEVFGELLPDTTAEERTSWEDRSGSPDDWYLSNRPPHHERDP
jgi:hypothetical protein